MALASGHPRRDRAAADAVWDALLNVARSKTVRQALTAPRALGLSKHRSRSKHFKILWRKVKSSASAGKQQTADLSIILEVVMGARILALQQSYSCASNSSSLGIKSTQCQQHGIMAKHATIGALPFSVHVACHFAC